MKTLAFALLALVACSKSDKSDKPADKPAEPAALSCSDTLTAAYGRLPGGNPQMAAIRGKLTEVMVQRCAEDKWPTAVLDCYSKASTQPAMKQCRETLPPDLAAKAQAAIVQIMSGAGGGGMMHGSPPAGSGSGS